MTDPHSHEAKSVAFSWWMMLGISAAVFVLVMVVMAIALYRGSHTSVPHRDEAQPGRLAVFGGGILLPGFVMLVLMLMTIIVARQVTEGASDNTLRIDVTAHQWWWELRYRAAGFTTANELHIPAGQRVQITLRSQDVIHSFWVPQLAGKTDLIPGRPNVIDLKADEPGTYEGKCTEFCGLQHANMRFQVIADAPADFARWLQDQQQDAAPLTSSSDPQLLAGQQNFLASPCVSCHTVRGTSAAGKLGPDLTHLASRQRIASGVLPNTLGNLAGWILDPQSVKPGTQMPPQQVDSSKFQALLQYLQSLK